MYFDHLELKYLLLVSCTYFLYCVNASGCVAFYSPYTYSRRYRLLISPESHFVIHTLCGLVVRVSGYRYRGLGFDSRRYQIF